MYYFVIEILCIIYLICFVIIFKLVYDLYIIELIHSANSYLIPNVFDYPDRLKHGFLYYANYILFKKEQNES